MGEYTGVIHSSGNAIFSKVLSEEVENHQKYFWEAWLWRRIEKIKSSGSWREIQGQVCLNFFFFLRGICLNADEKDSLEAEVDVAGEKSGTNESLEKDSEVGTIVLW